MPLFPATRDAGEEYADVDTLLCADDRPAHDVRMPWWLHQGRGVVIRVQALGLKEQEAIHRAAQVVAVRQARQDADKLGGALPWQALLPTDGRDWLAFCVGTLQHGIIAPRLNEAQARQLASKNRYAIEELVNYIWTLGQLDPDRIAAVVRELAGDDPDRAAAAGADAQPGA